LPFPQLSPTFCQVLPHNLLPQQLKHHCEKIRNEMSWNFSCLQMLLRKFLINVCARPPLVYSLTHIHVLVSHWSIKCTNTIPDSQGKYEGLEPCKGPTPSILHCHCVAPHNVCPRMSALIMSV
jgi:hypothetical protein